MEDWERTFRDQSLRRQQKAKRRNIVQRLAVLTGITAAVAGALWAINLMSA
jgi:hypothetical protein